MSLDFYLNTRSVCPHCGKPIGDSIEVWSSDITHNVLPMWRLAGCDKALYESEGKQAAEILPDLERGLAAMREEPDRFHDLNPSNGWGTYEGAVEWLANLIDVCAAHPNAVVHVSC